MDAGLNIVFIVIDGVRREEWRRAATYLPNLARLKRRGVHFSGMRISNPVGISLPAYADMFAGRRQEKIVDNYSHPESQYPTIFEAFAPKLPVALFASWNPLLKLAGAGDFFKGYAAGLTKPEVYDKGAADSDTFLHFMTEVPKRRPRFIFVHFGDADEEGHLGERPEYGIFHYRQALRASDHYVGRVWEFLESHPFYAGRTYLYVATDHGRDGEEWWHHGLCVERGQPLCDDCKEVFALVLGPQLCPCTVRRACDHRDFAPTFAELLGVPFPSATGRALEEALPQ